MTARCDTRAGFAELDKLAQGVKRARIRAINELRKQAKTAGLRQVNDTYQIGPRTMEQFVSESIATQDTPEASIKVKGKRFPLSAFKPQRNSKGVSVLLKGRRITVPHAFIGQFGDVVARGAYRGKNIRQRGDDFMGFKFGKGRLPVTALVGMSAAEAFGARVVVDAMQARVDEQARGVLIRELQAVSRGF